MEGARSLLAEDPVAHHDLALFAILDFLCACASVQPVRGQLFKPQDVRRRLLSLVKQMDLNNTLHLNMVGRGDVHSL